MDRKYIAVLARDWGLVLVGLTGAYLLWALVLAPSSLSSGPAPDFTLPRLDGSEFTLSTIAGDDEVVILNFWFTTCGPCRHEIPELSAFYNAHPETPMYGISIDAMPPNQLRQASRSLEISYEVLQDRNQVVAGLYGVSVYPTTIIVRGKEVVAGRVGEVSQASLERMVTAARQAP